MKHCIAILVAGLSAGVLPAGAEALTPVQQLVGKLGDALTFVRPATGAPVQSFRIQGTVTEAAGVLKPAQSATFEWVIQPPRHMKLQVSAAGHPLTFCWNDEKIWIHFPDKKLLITGDPAVPRFSTRPSSVQPVDLDLFRLPVTRTHLAVLPALVEVSSTPGPEAGSYSWKMTPSEGAAAVPLPVTAPQVTATFSGSGPQTWPSALAYRDKDNALTLRIDSAASGGALPEETWTAKPGPDDVQESVALAHLERFAKSSFAALGSRIPTLPPATGKRWLVASSGKGRLEDHDGTRVLFLQGTPTEMGHQHGELLRTEVRRVVDRILYGVGVGSSVGKGRWFFGEIEEAVRRTAPWIDPRHLAEMDAIAAAAGLDAEEVRLANFFPELFHCSGFAVLGKATVGGEMYHGRILDYLRGAGLEENAVVVVQRPDQGNAWVNISYAGFTGSVTAMNEKQLSIGEMGGRGEGSWDGKPMAQLVREVMEKTSTVDEALELMRRTPRTCEYYYVIADAKSGRAAGVKATAEIFDVIWTGEAHPELSDPVPDTVLLSAGDRYTELVKRVKGQFGRLDAAASLGLMSRPVCMTSNIHSVLFAPGSLDFWVANADSTHVASETRYTQYNLRSLLQDPPATPRP